MEITYALSNFDSSKSYLEFRNFQIQINRRKKDIFDIFILYLIGFIASIVLINDETIRRTLLISIIVLFVIFYLFFDYFISGMLLVYSIFRKNKKNTKTIILSATAIFSILHKDSIDLKHTEQILYSQISHIQQSKSYIGILDMQEKYFAIIPNRVFATPEDKELFMSLLKRNTRLEIE